MKSTSRRRAKRARFVSLRRHLKCDDEATWREQEGNVAERFFAGAEEENSLRGLLDEEATDQAVESAVSPVSAAYDEAGSLERAAMRSTRREEEVVRWVRMSEVQVSDEATSSSSRARARPSETNGVLALKLDYKEVEDAWDKGRPFFHSQPSNSQIVPDLTTDNHFFYHHNCILELARNNIWELVKLNGANGEQWGVPDQNSCNHNHGMEGKGERSIEGWRLGQREASVLRYKEKRMNRLFSKRIRYQVRKLNAEKRPRVKGRFVKRS